MRALLITSHVAQRQAKRTGLMIACHWQSSYDDRQRSGDACLRG